MKMMHTMASEALAPAPKRRLYSPELKNQVVAQARLPGASIAGVALSHGINANIVHRWLRERAGQAPQRSGLRGIEPAESMPTATGR
jgi:transposase